MESVRGLRGDHGAIERQIVAAREGAAPALGALLDVFRNYGQRLTPKRSASIVAAISDAMHYAHSQGVLHRDLKPSNVLLEPRPAATLAGGIPSETFPFTPKITDFGLAKIEDASGGVTRTGSILGTPSYMAPEQAEGRLSDIGPATDVYGLGAVLYELLTGRGPFAGASEMDVLRRVLSDEPIRPSRVDARIPADIEAICSKCLEKRPANRYATAGELADDLRRFVAGEPTTARPLQPQQRLWRWARRRPAVAALVAVCVLVALTIVGGSTLYSMRRGAALAESKDRRIETDRMRAAAVRSRQETTRQKEANAKFLYAARMRQAFQALSGGDVGETAGLLAEYADGSPWSDLRSFEWHYLKRSLQGERLALMGHKGQVYGVAFSPDGRILASASEDGLIKLWDPTSGRELRSITAHASCANDLSFSPDGRLLASASCDRTVKLWDTTTWREISSFNPGPRSVMTSVAFSPDGRLLAAGDNDSGIVSVWEVATATLIIGLESARFHSAQSHGVDALAWSPDGRLLAAAAIFGGTRLWETIHWQKVQDLQQSSAVAFSPDSKLIATHSDDATLKLWDTDSGKLHSTIAARLGRVHKIGFGVNTRQLFACGSDGTVKIWTLTDEGRADSKVGFDGAIAPVARTLVGHSSRVQGFTVSPDGRALATASFDGTVRLWDLAASGGTVPVFQCSAIAASLSANLDRLTVVSSDRRLVTWDVSSGKPVDDLPIGPLPHEYSLTLSPDGQVLGARSLISEQLLLGDTRLPTELRPIKTHRGGVQQIEFSGDGCVIASVGFDGFVRVWNTQTGEERHAAEFSHAPDTDVQLRTAGIRLALSADGRKLAIANTLSCIVDIDTGKRSEIPLLPGEGGVNQIAFSPDSTLLAISRFDGHAYLVDLATGEILQTMRLPRHASVFAFSPDSQTLATGIDNGLVMLWHVATGQELTRFPTQPGEVSRLQFSTDCLTLAAIVIDEESEASLYVWLSHDKQ